MGLSRTVSEINGNIAKFSHPVYLKPWLRGSALNLLTDVGLKKTRIMPLPVFKKILTMTIFQLV